jgi:hypothetical protein
MSKVSECKESNHRRIGTGASRSHADTPAYTYAQHKKKLRFGWQLAACCGQLRTHLLLPPLLRRAWSCLSCTSAACRSRQRRLHSTHTYIKSACINYGPPVPAWPPVISCSAPHRRRRTCWFIRRAPAGCEPCVVSRESEWFRACLAVRPAACSFPPSRSRGRCSGPPWSAIFEFLQRVRKSSKCAATGAGRPNAVCTSVSRARGGRVNLSAAGRRAEGVRRGGLCRRGIWCLDPAYHAPAVC